MPGLCHWSKRHPQCVGKRSCQVPVSLAWSSMLYLLKLSAAPIPGPHFACYYLQNWNVLIFSQNVVIKKAPPSNKHRPKRSKTRQVQANPFSEKQKQKNKTKTEKKERKGNCEYYGRSEGKKSCSSLIVISTFRRSKYFWRNSFKLSSNSLVTTFWRNAPLILQTQGTSHRPPTLASPAKKPCICPCAQCVCQRLTQRFFWEESLRDSAKVIIPSGEREKVGILDRPNTA